MSSTNFRAFRIDFISSGSATILMNQHGTGGTSVGYDLTGSVVNIGPIKYNSTGSTGLPLDKVWGIMKGEAHCSGSLTLQGGGSLSLASLDNHQIFPCYPKSLTVSAGTVILLS
jgi:hypothetical protein